MTDRASITITRQDREKITATSNLKEGDRYPGAEYVPQGYISSKEIVPAMGVHWVDPSRPEFNGQPFTRTFIYGYYKGRLAFLKPMATVKYFQTQPDFSQPIKQPNKYRKPGYYPKSYSIKYNLNRAEYTVSLDDITYRK